MCKSFCFSSLWRKKIHTLTMWATKIETFLWPMTAKCLRTFRQITFFDNNLWIKTKNFMFIWLYFIVCGVLCSAHQQTRLSKCVPTCANGSLLYSFVLPIEWFFFHFYYILSVLSSRLHRMFALELIISFLFIPFLCVYNEITFLFNNFFYVRCLCCVCQWQQQRTMIDHDKANCLCT